MGEALRIVRMRSSLLRVRAQGISFEIVVFSCVHCIVLDSELDDMKVSMIVSRMAVKCHLHSRGSSKGGIPLPFSSHMPSMSQRDLDRPETSCFNNDYGEWP